MQKNTPKISVIMPVYNAGMYIRESIESIINQTQPDFEFLIYNDGSTDDSDEIIKSYNDPRIKYTKIENNVGLVVLLNRGIYESRGQFIARMDADDISYPNRLEEQLKFMIENPNIGICGSFIEQFGSQSAIVTLPESNLDINCSLFYGTPFAHPTVMMRTSILRENILFYDNNFLYAEDYELFERMSLLTKAANLPKVLLKYRLHDTQISTKKWNKQYFLVGKIQARRFIRVLKEPTSSDLKFLEDYFTYNSNINKSWFGLIDYYKKKVIIENNLYPKEVIEKAINAFSEKNENNNIKQYLLRDYYNSSNFSIKLLLKFFNEEKRVRKHLNNKLFFRFILKCIFYYKKKC